MNTLFLGGIPTEPDVKRLRDKYHALTVDQIIPYADLEASIGSKKGTARFGSVVGAWRKWLFGQHNIILDAIKNTGFKVANPESRIIGCGDRYKRGLKQISKSGNIAAQTDSATLSDEQKRLRDHLIKVAALHRTIANTEAKQLRYPVNGAK